MAFIKMLSDNAQAVEVFALRPETQTTWPPLSRSCFRGDSEFNPGQQELIGAYASALRGCNHCYSAHRPVAEAFGIDPEFFEKMMDDFDNAPLDDKMKAVLRYVKKLTEEPSRLIQKDVDDVIAAGWTEEAIVDIAMICAAFAFMNTMMMALGADKVDMSGIGPLTVTNRAAVYKDEAVGPTNPEVLLKRTVEQFGEEATQKAIAEAMRLGILGQSAKK